MKLAALFRQNFATYEAGVSTAIREAGPVSATTIG